MERTGIYFSCHRFLASVTQSKVGLESSMWLSDWEAQITMLSAQQRWGQQLGKCPKHRVRREKGSGLSEIAGTHGINLGGGFSPMQKTLGAWIPDLFLPTTLEASNAQVWCSASETPCPPSIGLRTLLAWVWES